MKEKWMERFSLVLSIVMLITLVIQNRQIQRLRIQLESIQENVLNQMDFEADSVRQSLYSINNSFAVLNKIVKTYGITFAGFNIDEQSILLDVKVWLDVVDTNTQLELTVHAPSDPQDSEWYRGMLSMGADNAFSGRISLPADTKSKLVYTICAYMGGEKLTEELCIYDSVAKLLPVQIGKCSGNSIYNNGTLYQNKWTVSLVNMQREPISVENPKLCIYKNNEILQDTPCNIGDATGRYWVGKWEYDVSCMPGDELEIRFVCGNESGLHYEFLIKKWVISKAQVMPLSPESFDPTLTWPQ